MTRLMLILPRMSLILLLFTMACDSPGASLFLTSPQSVSATPAVISSNDSSATQRDYTESMQVGGLTRTYYIHLPLSYNGQHMLPLVLAFHGSGSTGKDLAQQSHLNNVADTGGFIIVYPAGYDQQWADGRGTTSPEQAGVDDVGFVSALIDKLSAKLHVDKNRVYVTGLSNGGIFAQRLACELTNKITAIASVSGTMAENISQQCQPARSIPVLLFMGTNDASVPFDGGEVDGDQGIDLSATATIQLWRMDDACSSIPSVIEVPPAINDGTAVYRIQYNLCKNNADVILYTIEGGVHTWPGGADIAQTSEPSDSLDASQVIWLFFQQYQL